MCLLIGHTQMTGNRATALLVVTWLLVIPSVIAWDANASMELHGGGETCEIPKAQVITVKLAPFECTTEGAVRYQQSTMKIHCE